MTRYLKAPTGELDFEFSWDDGYLATATTAVAAEKISSSLTSVSVVPSYSTAATDHMRTTDVVASTLGVVFKLLGGRHGLTYKVTATITTTLGRKDQRSMFVKGWSPL